MKKLKKTPKEINDVSYQIGFLTEAIEDLKVHFTNHLHNHYIDRIINVALFISTVAMFCFLKWGT